MRYHTSGHRSADQNEPFHSMLKGPGHTAVRQSLHEGDSQATQTTTRYHDRQGDAIHLSPIERNHGEIRNRTTTKHGVPPTNRRTEGTNQCHIRTIPPSLHQLSTRRLLWLPTIGRICIQQWLSGDHKEKPFFENYRINHEYEMIGHLIQGQQTKRGEMTKFHESLGNQMVGAQLRQKDYNDLQR